MGGEHVILLALGRVEIESQTADAISMADDIRIIAEAFMLSGRPVLSVGEDQNIIFANPAAEELTGFQNRELVGRSWRMIFDQPSILRVEAMIDILSNNTGQQGRQELQLKVTRKTGRFVTTNLTVSVLASLNKKLWLFDLEDLSPILDLQREKELLQEEMGRVSKLADIGRLTGGIAHELNNPLAILQGLTENLIDQAEHGELNSKIALRELKPMEETITRMTRIIQSMMSVARGEEPVMEALPVAELWDRAVLGFQAMNQLKNVTIKSEIDAHHLVTVDSIRIEQIFVNLVKNSLHALEEVPPGHREIRVSSQETNDRILVRFENNGPPIPPRVADSIFTPFFTTKPVGEGMGLGLFLSYNVMKAHGGSLSHENIKPTGVRFILNFPKKRRTFNRTKHRILIVDDEVLFRQMFARKLETMGFVVTMARTGDEALAAFGSGKDYDLLITDLRMPIKDGTHLVEAIRKISSIPIIFVTGYGREGALQRLLDKGIVQGIVQKPFQDEDLVVSVESALKTTISKAG
ncbi:MAG: hypothetical protein C5B49_08170 [Bdellovibrio sp.]|nr:MAG: hypothetical protein C5B49_08170 [Bdellovibrio sp.]